MAATRKRHVPSRRGRFVYSTSKIASISTAFSKIGHSLQRQADTTGELEVKQKGDADSKALAEQNRNDPNAANHIPRARKANAELDRIRKRLASPPPPRR